MSTHEDQAKDTLTPARQKQPAAAKKKAAPSTEYVVIEGNDGEVWKVGPNVAARSADEAVRKGSNGKPGTYMAIPARSWKAVKVTVEKIERVKLEAAS